MVHFVSGGEIESIIFRHTDGYPEGNGTDILRFLKECSTLKDTRFFDASILASRYVCWLAKRVFTGSTLYFDTETETLREGHWVDFTKRGPNDPPLLPGPDLDHHFMDFLSIRVLLSDTSDSEYVYKIHCDGPYNGKKLPKVECFEVIGYDDEEGRCILGKKCPIPSPKKAEADMLAECIRIKREDEARKAAE